MLKAKYAGTRDKLARALGITNHTLKKYWGYEGRPIDRNSGDTRYDIEAYRKWMAQFKRAHNFGTRGALTDEPIPVDTRTGYQFNERERGLIEKNRIAAAREKFKLEVEMAEYVPRIKVNNTIDTGNAIVRRELEKAFCSELPPRLEGLKAGEIRRVLVTRLNEAFQHLPARLTKTNGSNGH